MQDVVSTRRMGETGAHLQTSALLAALYIVSCDGACTGSTGAAESLVLHWNGTSWSHVSSPNVAVDQTILRGVSARASDDVWAVGVTRDTGCSPYVCYKTVTMRWDGTSWNIVSSPNPVPNDVNGLFGVVAIGANNAWAVGACTYGTGGIKETMIFQWDGSAWSRVTSPNAGTNVPNRLDGIAAVDEDHILAVGRTEAASSQTLVERWDGTDWEIVSSPNQGSNGSWLDAVTVVPGTSICSGGDIWAVGAYKYTSTLLQILTERYSFQSGCNP